MTGSGSHGPIEQIWRAALTLLLAAIATYVAWTLLQSVIGPLIIIVALVVILRLAVGWRSRNDW